MADRDLEQIREALQFFSFSPMAEQKKGDEKRGTGLIYCVFSIAYFGFLFNHRPGVAFSFRLRHDFAETRCRGRHTQTS